MTFKEIYDTRPDKAEVGSSGYSNLKHLFHLVKEINPTIIIESGTWKGNSSYLFKHASNAEIHCYDIYFGNLMWSDKSISYFEFDITNEDFDWIENKDDVLLYFDDHINQHKRIDWAIEKGFKNIIFDDNITTKEAKIRKNPASPTLQMIEFENNYKYKEYQILPNLTDGRDTCLTLVRL
jgi:hypothetical protein